MMLLVVLSSEVFHGRVPADRQAEEMLKIPSYLFVPLTLFAIGDISVLLPFFVSPQGVF